MKRYNFKPALLIAAILLVSLAIRIVMLNVFVCEKGIESFEYNEIAKNVVSGEGYVFDYMGTTYRSFAPPLYAFILFVIYKIAGVGYIQALWLQIILSLSSCLLIFFIARHIASTSIALVAMALSSFHPGLILYSVKKIHSLNLDVFLFLLVILFAIRLKESFTLKRAFFAGMAFGLSALSRPSILAFFPFFCIWLLMVSNRSFLTKCVNLTAVFFIMTLIILPWVVRNYIVHKEFVLSTTCDAEVFWRGNNSNATGSSYLSDGSTVLIKDKVLFSKIAVADELGKRTIFREEVFKFIKENPVSFARLYLKKFYYFWWFSPQSGLLYPRSYYIVYKTFYALILLSAIVGFASLKSDTDGYDVKNAYLLILFMITISLFQSLYYVEGRHRWGIEPILMVFSAMGIARISIALKKRFCRI